MGRSSVLTAGQEMNLVEEIIHFAEKCLLLTPLSVRRYVWELHSVPHLFCKTKQCAGMLCYQIVITFCVQYLIMNFFCRSEMLSAIYEASATAQ